MPTPPREIRTIAGRDVAITNPDKIYFPAAGYTKRDVVDYYLAVADAAIRGVARRPMNLKRFVDGIASEPFFQKRAPKNRPAWIETATFSFPSGRSADEVVVTDAAQLAWVINLGCIDLNPHAVRADDMDHPDELRIDLDPVPGVEWKQIVDVSRVVREVLADHGLVGWPKTSGSRGAHVWVRIEPRLAFDRVRRAGLALAREVERRAPEIASARWWKEERHGVFVDYNQNARDRTTASAYSVRPLPDARVSMPLSWADFDVCDPAEFTLKTVPPIVAARGDAHAAIDEVHHSLDALLELADRHDRDGLSDAPHPPGAKKVRVSKHPVIVIARAKAKADALAGLERWKASHPAIVAKLAPEDILVDTMRGRYTAWYRIRINLKRIPEAERPPPASPDPDYDIKSEWTA